MKDKKAYSEEEVRNADVDFCSMTELLNHDFMINHLSTDSIIETMKRKCKLFVITRNLVWTDEIINMTNFRPMYYFKNKHK